MKLTEVNVVFWLNSVIKDLIAIPFMTKDRMPLLTFLEENNIQTLLYFVSNVTRHPVYRQYLEEFPNSDRIMAE